MAEEAVKEGAGRPALFPLFRPFSAGWRQRTLWDVRALTSNRKALILCIFSRTFNTQHPA
jgi:hypothetical protein